jgi:hypothetical protein
VAVRVHEEAVKMKKREELAIEFHLGETHLGVDLQVEHHVAAEVCFVHVGKVRGELGAFGKVIWGFDMVSSIVSVGSREEKGVRVDELDCSEEVMGERPERKGSEVVCFCTFFISAWAEGLGSWIFQSWIHSDRTMFA